MSINGHFLIEKLNWMDGQTKKMKDLHKTKNLVGLKQTCMF